MHAAKKICTDISDELRSIVEDEFGGHWAIDLPRGALIATATLVACHPSGGICTSGEERALGDFTPGRFGWQVENMIALPEPIPYTGHQSLFDVPDEVFGMPPTPAVQGSLL